MIRIRDKLKKVILEKKNSEKIQEKIKSYYEEVREESKREIEDKFKNISYKNLTNYTENEQRLAKIDIRLEELEKLREELSLEREEVLKEIKRENLQRMEKVREENEKKFNPKVDEKIYQFKEGRSSYLREKRFERINKYLKYVYTEDPNEPKQAIGEYYDDYTHLVDSKSFKNVNETQRRIIEEKAKTVYVRVPGKLMSDAEEYENNTLDDLEMDIHMICHSHLDLGWLEAYTELFPSINFFL